MYSIKSLQDAIMRRDLLTTVSGVENLCKKSLKYKLVKTCNHLAPIMGINAEELEITPYNTQGSIKEALYIKGSFCVHYARRHFWRKKEGLICSIFFKGWMSRSRDISGLESSRRDLKLTKIKFRGYGSERGGKEETTPECFKKKLYVSPEVIRVVTLQELTRELLKKENNTFK